MSEPFLGREPVILVVGDCMLDQYWQGKVERISPEAPIPVVHILDQKDRAGGAANVAMNLAALGVPPVLISARGADLFGQKLGQILETHGIACFWSETLLKTTRKLRVLAQHQQLIRLDFEEKTVLNNHQETLDDLFYTQCALLKPDVVIFSDYAKGCLGQVQSWIAAAKKAGAYVIVDPKSRDLSVYRGADLITPNRKECEDALGPWKDMAELEQKARQAIKDYAWSSMVVTLGEKGLSLFQQDKERIDIASEAQEVFDVTGAGDTVIAVLGWCLAQQYSLGDSVILANKAAGWAVGKLGAVAIDKDSLLSLSTNHRLRKKSEEIIVFTNGCFDLLHRGHLSYLQQAKNLGTRLVVGVNTDASVSRLKGDQRPIRSLEERMEFLRALSMVDEVIPFDEDTPLRLIQELRPDILVKGGDYSIETIVGASEVLAWGGRVYVIPFVEGYSSTALIERIKKSV